MESFIKYEIQEIICNDCDGSITARVEEHAPGNIAPT